MHLQPGRSLADDRSFAAPRNIWWSALSLLAFSAGLRLINLDSLPRIDELYTLMAARGWMERGVPQVGDGLYERAWLYTALVGQVFRVLGESLVAARLPAVLAGSLLVVAVFLWTRAVSGVAAAWVAALFVALDPLAIQQSQFARFYALHALAFWLGAIAVYGLVEQRPAPAARLALALGAGLALALAHHLQPSTLIGVAGLGVWLVVALALPPRRPAGRWRWGGAAALAVLGLALLLAAVQSGLAAELWERYRWVPLHAAPVRNQVWYYHLHLIERYPSLWPLFPFAALLALAAAPRPALLGTVVFATALALLSLGGMKHLNYLFFVLPFLFVIWALALVQVFRILRALALAATAGALRRLAPASTPGRAASALIGVALVFLVLANGAPARTLFKPFGITLGTDESAIDWAPAASALAPWLERADVVLSPNDLHALHYLGHYDVAVNASRLSELRAEEFALDWRTGRPVIATLAALTRILDCYPSGALVVDDTMYRVHWALSDAMVDLLERQTTPLEVTPGVRAFIWEHPGGGNPAACRALPDHLPPPAGRG